MKYFPSKRRKRRWLMRRDPPQCFYCGQPLTLDDSTLDHFWPRARGGTGHFTNLVLACARCNVSKADRLITEIAIVARRGAGVLLLAGCCPISEEEIVMIANASGKLVGFNYRSLDPDVAKATQEHARAIHALVKTTAEAIIEIGRRLNESRELLGPSKFSAWLNAEWRWTQAHASHLMTAARKFADCPHIDKFVEPSALYLLAREKTPPAAVQETMSRAAAGHNITRQDVVQILAKHTPAGEVTISEDELSRRIRRAVTFVAEQVGPQFVIRCLSELLTELNGGAGQVPERKSA